MERAVLGVSYTVYKVTAIALGIAKFEWQWAALLVEPMADRTVRFSNDGYIPEDAASPSKVDR